VKSTSFARDPRSTSARSNTARQRGASVPNRLSTVKLVDQETEPKQEESQEPLTVRARFSGCVPNSPNALVFFLFVVIYLICAMIHFIHTDDGGMLITLLPYLSGYVGIPMVTSHIPWGKNKGNDQQS
jgi:hypothetical protein